MTLTQKVLLVLEHVPVPYVPQAAAIVDSIIEEVHQMHVDAAANGTAPPSLDALKAVVADANVAAQEPWKRIADRAGTPTRDPRGETVTGSQGG